MNKILFFIIIVFFKVQNIFSYPTIYDDYSKGPLYGKNFYIPYLIFYSFSGENAGFGKQNEFQYHISLYYINDFSIIYLSYEKYYKYFVSKEIDHLEFDYGRDYESLVCEIGASYFIKKFIQVGFEIRLLSYYGGFMDSIIETFHTIFGFPNGGREYFWKNVININIQNSNGYLLKMNNNSFSFGDIDLWLKYSLFHNRWLRVAIFFAFKIPAGSVQYLSGSGTPDIANSLLIDIKPIWFLTFYIQNGFVIPLPSNEYKPKPMYQGIYSIEINPTSIFSLIVQMNLKTSALESSYKHYNNMEHYVNYFKYPQTNLLVGIKFRYKGFIWQIYVEEDFLTNEGTDITLNFLFKHSIKLF